MKSELLKYEIEVFPEDSDDDDGTMTRSAEELRDAVIGHKIVAVEKRKLTAAEQAFIKERDGGYFSIYSYGGEYTFLTLSNQTVVLLSEMGDCCAYTSVDAFRLLDTDHVITSVGTKDGFDSWFIYTENSIAAELDVSWSCGNPFYYAYGVSIEVLPLIISVVESSVRKEITNG